MKQADPAVLTPADSATGGAVDCPAPTSPATPYIYVTPKRAFFDLTFGEKHCVVEALRMLRGRYNPTWDMPKLKAFVRHLNNIEDYICGRESLLAYRRTLR